MIELEQRLVRDDVMSEKEGKSFFKLEVDQLEQAEHEMELKVGRLIRKHPVWTEGLKHVKGIGPRLGGLSNGSCTEGVADEQQGHHLKLLPQAN